MEFQIFPLQKLQNTKNEEYQQDRMKIMTQTYKRINIDDKYKLYLSFQKTDATCDLVIGFYKYQKIQ